MYRIVRELNFSTKIWFLISFHLQKSRSPWDISIELLSQCHLRSQQLSYLTGISSNPEVWFSVTFFVTANRLAEPISSALWTVICGDCFSFNDNIIDLNVSSHGSHHTFWKKPLAISTCTLRQIFRRDSLELHWEVGLSFLEIRTMWHKLIVYWVQGSSYTCIYLLCWQAWIRPLGTFRDPIATLLLLPAIHTQLQIFVLLEYYSDMEFLWVGPEADLVAWTWFASSY